MVIICLTFNSPLKFFLTEKRLDKFPDLQDELQLVIKLRIIPSDPPDSAPYPHPHPQCWGECASLQPVLSGIGDETQGFVYRKQALHQ